MWLTCSACDGDATCDDGCCGCTDCQGRGGAEFPDNDQDEENSPC